MKLVKIDKTYYNPEQVRVVSPHPEYTTECYIDGTRVHLPVERVVSLLTGEELKLSEFTVQKSDAWDIVYQLCCDLGMDFYSSKAGTGQETVLGFIKMLHKSHQTLEGIKDELKEAE